MTKKHHPINRYERKEIAALKDVNEIPKKKERASKVWRKLTRETLKDWETSHELKEHVAQH